MLAVLMLGAVPGIRAEEPPSPALESLKKQAAKLAPGQTAKTPESIAGVEAKMPALKTTDEAQPAGRRAVLAPIRKSVGGAGPLSTSARNLRFQVRDWKACLDWMTMDIDVIVDDERFSFHPNCDFSFNRSFKTKKGKQCRVEAGMCSSWYPENAFAVRCDGGIRGEIGIPCKDSGDDGVLIEPDWESCVDGWMSMSVKVTVEAESFEFHPNCDWQFSERFETKAGGSCQVESGMCTSWHPKNRFEVTCEKGQRGFATIPCKSR